MTDDNDKRIALYHKSYGSNPGAEPDFTRCCENIWDNTGWGRNHQCSRKAVTGPHNAYCKQHSPDAVAERKAKESARFKEERVKWATQSRAAKAIATLRLIADGHNDPRELARQFVENYDEAVNDIYKK